MIRKIQEKSMPLSKGIGINVKNNNHFTLFLLIKNEKHYPNRFMLSDFLLYLHAQKPKNETNY